MAAVTPSSEQGLAEHYLSDVDLQLRKLKGLADRALAQLGDDGFFATLDADANSVAIIVKHVAGNLRSRWTDFLTTDGEKPDRHRDQEFETAAGDTRARLMERWEAGWQCLFDALAPLNADDLQRIVTIRTEPHTVLEAIQRQMSHYAYHVGQIVLLARHYTAGGWQSLSIPRGKSREYDVAKNGERYGADR